MESLSFLISGDFIWVGLLFVAETEQGVALAILRGVIDFKREPWPQISESAKSLVRQMLEPDPKKRLTAEQVLGKSLTQCLVGFVGEGMEGRDSGFSIFMKFPYLV